MNYAFHDKCFDDFAKALYNIFHKKVNMIKDSGVREK